MLYQLQFYEKIDQLKDHPNKFIVDKIEQILQGKDEYDDEDEELIFGGELW